MEKLTILSKQTIKPSSPTPPRLKKLNLSFLDQLAPTDHFGLVFFYDDPLARDHPGPDHVPLRNQISTKLKHSLSDVLVPFFPLAGRIVDNSYIECNDAGAEYVEAQVHVSMADVTEDPDPEELKNYYPIGASTDEELPLAIQVSFFRGGGFAIGVCMAHKIADAESMGSFMAAWAAICRGEARHDKYAASPRFDLTCRFSPVEGYRSKPPPETGEKIMAKRLVFNRKKIAALKKQAAAGSDVENPTRVETLAAFIWRHSMWSVAENKLFLALFAVNMRTRAVPPFPGGYFGNGVGQAMAFSNGEERDHPGQLVAKLRSAVRGIDGEYVKKIEYGEEYLKESSGQLDDPSSNDEKPKLVEFCIFSSWCRFPFYEVNYGWGKPYWVSTVAVPIKNMVVFIDSKDQDGVEAWVNMTEEDLALIEKSYKQLS